MRNSEVTVVLPVFQPTSKSTSFLRDLLSQNDANHRILIIDNGNYPPIADLIDSSSPSRSRAEIHRLDENAGWGGAVMLGAALSKTRLVCWAPTNGKLTASAVIKFVSMGLAYEGSLVKAHRVGRSPGFSAKAGLAGLVHTLILGVRMWDSGGTPTLAEKSLLLGLPKSPPGAAFDAFVMFHAATRKIPVKRIQVKYKDFPKLQSSWRRGLFSEIKLFTEIVFFSKTAVK